LPDLWDRDDRLPSIIILAPVRAGVLCAKHSYLDYYYWRGTEKQVRPYIRTSNEVDPRQQLKKNALLLLAWSASEEEEGDLSRSITWTATEYLVVLRRYMPKMSIYSYE
jgi:hypothetical protein